MKLDTRITYSRYTPQKPLVDAQTEQSDRMFALGELSTELETAAGRDGPRGFPRTFRPVLSVRLSRVPGALTGAGAGRGHES